MNRVDLKLNLTCIDVARLLVSLGLVLELGNELFNLHKLVHSSRSVGLHLNFGDETLHECPFVNFGVVDDLLNDNVVELVICDHLVIVHHMMVVSRDDRILRIESGFLELFVG